ncbi:MAG: DUF5663 domain-containing protein [Patescibacteria group bacterium]
MDKYIRTFLRELLHDAGQTDLGSDLEEVMIQDLATRLEDRLMLTATQHLTEQQQAEVKKMSEGGKTPEEIMAYMKSSVPNFEQLVAQDMADFREVYINASKGE